MTDKIVTQSGTFIASDAAGRDYTIICHDDYSVTDLIGRPSITQHYKRRWTYFDPAKRKIFDVDFVSNGVLDIVDATRHDNIRVTSSDPLAQAP